MISIEKRGATVEDAINEGLVQLGMTREDVEVEIISEGGDGAQAVVKLSTKWTEEDGVSDYICGLLDRMDLDCSLDVKPTDAGYEVEISGDDAAIAIGHRGEVLDAIQYLATVKMNRDKETFTKVVVDAEGYRVRREKTLKDLAVRLATKAIREGVRVELEPMNPHDRKIVHETLAENDDIVTFSTGTEPNRFITIEPKMPEKIYGTQSAFRKNGIKTRSFGSKRRGF